MKKKQRSEFGRAYGGVSGHPRGAGIYAVEGCLDRCDGDMGSDSDRVVSGRCSGYRILSAGKQKRKGFLLKRINAILILYVNTADI